MITPQTKINKLAKMIKLNADLFFKREDLHPCGSHKGRSIPPMINHWAKLGWKNFCISSSGNAAIAAALAVKNINKKNKKKLSLAVFVGKNIPSEKLKILKKLSRGQVSLKTSDNPKQSAFQMDKKGEAKNLRQSTDDTALSGYESLAKELAGIQNISAVFIPASSGTAAQGLCEGFKKLRMSPQIHIVQTTACHPIADLFSRCADTKTSLAGAIVDKVARRKQAVAQCVKKSKGFGWIASDKDILEAIKLVKKTENLDISPNSALSVAGLIQALKNGRVFEGPVVCLITGK